MTRSRSPGYPNMSLPKALERVKKVFDADRQNPIDRDSAARHIGYGGLSGAADKALASLMHYGLLERVGKGEVKVSQLAVDLLHPEPGADRRASLREAADNPSLFHQLNERFDTTPSAETLRSFLKRESFLERAIDPVISAYLETCSFLKQEGAYEFVVPSPARAEESAPVAERESIAMNTGTQISPATPTPPTLSGADVLNLSGGGHAALRLPETLTETEYEDLKDWLDLMARRAKRRVTNEPRSEN